MLKGFGAMASKVAAQASGAACNCARSAALEQQLAAERKARAAEQKARAAENCAKDALLAVYQAELAAKPKFVTFRRNWGRQSSDSRPRAAFIVKLFVQSSRFIPDTMPV